MARILLIEPNSLLAGQYQAVLHHGGHEVSWCANGQDGIEQADGINPDLLILELLLPGHSGVEFLYEFRSYADWQDLPAIVLSSVPRPELKLDAKSMTDLGVVTYLYKPETPLAKLLRSVNRALSITPHKP
jgi:DNA-binding response OmpR family regulator